MRILITNDDGVNAVGITILKEALKKVADVTLVAPFEERSASGHAITISRALKSIEIAPGVFGLDGFPADCTAFGIKHVFKGVRPDLVVSGINYGANMGQDVYYSGTVAGAREGAFLNVPSIAASMVLDHHEEENYVHFKEYAEFLKNFILDGGHRFIPKYHVANFNFPNIDPKEAKGVKLTQLGFRRYSEKIVKVDGEGHGDYYKTAGKFIESVCIKDSDCEAISRGYISLTLINMLPLMNSNDEALEKFAEDTLIKTIKKN